MLPAERRLAGIRPLIDEEAYFVIHAPRQTGKTTCFQSLARSLTQEGSHAAVLVSCKVAASAGNDVERGIRAVIGAIADDASRQLAAELQPPPPEQLNGIDTAVRLKAYLGRWCEQCPRPVVLFLDEIDALLDDTLLSVLDQLHAGYSSRPGHFPHSLALIGLRDVRDYKVRGDGGSRHIGTSSPFNVKIESLRLRYFTPDEINELYHQHTVETGQAFTKEAAAHAFELTRGQPWLVNALARQVVTHEVPGPAGDIAAVHIESAKETLIQRRDTHLDSLVDRLREGRVQRVIEPILAGDLLLGDCINDDRAYVEDLGLIELRDGALVIANPIYHEIIPRALAYMTQVTIPKELPWFVDDRGMLDMPALLDCFAEFWLEHGEVLLASQPYHEIAPHLVLMGFLQRIVNSGGTIDREYAVGRGRIDLCIRWRHAAGLQVEAIEIKVHRDGRSDPLSKGLRQLAAYLERLNLDHGTLLIFDRRSNAPPLPERYQRSEIEEQNRSIRVLRL